ncbi:MAG: UDP-N-acetylmuramate-L-alanine ligase [Candidatus Uhrbacteria bacterium GW2011_GWA2_52_8d]|uniref:UDP-N-acetylmuramate--L-alanine ligase n=1 Tax=Candidatus Uhrbacteria bacterium GW2011_GWA2_52_8d TaxID=1618979 RepID=A0A0G2AL56_9BACT|nr:MAG: UDP-N-acetylmuramate-L-alanine ligase [Candidatus Uhrbacteria bacterium GW2011_GWA2_52_8d]
MFQHYKHVHFVGIGGIGMSALAKWFLQEGVAVSGSDVHLSPITHDLETRGAKIYSGHAGTNLAESIDLLIYSPAVPDTNLERVSARERGIPERTNFEVLGEISKLFSTIVVSGTNGKSTTTAMLGLMLEAAGYDPTVLVGSLVPGFKDGNYRHGGGRFFVVEGCEYRANMLQLHPEMIVLTNIEEDHLDYYRDLTHIQETFQTFVDKLKGQGMVVVNADDAGSAVLNVSRPVTYGSDRSNTTYAFTQRKTAMGSQTVQTNVGELELQIPGEFNVYNALAAMSAAMELGVPFETCRRVLKDFSGIWRRFERVGVWKGADIISDYGHHPSSIKQTVEATREFFPSRRIVLCYQPHQHDRTKKLFEEFVEVLPLADHLVLTEIYDVAGRSQVHDVSSKDLVDVISKNDPGKDVRYAQDLSAAESHLREIVQLGDVVLIMGAGDIDEVARKLV